MVNRYRNLNKIGQGAVDIPDSSQGTPDKNTLDSLSDLISMLEKQYRVFLEQKNSHSWVMSSEWTKQLKDKIRETLNDALYINEKTRRGEKVDPAKQPVTLNQPANPEVTNLLNLIKQNK